MTKTTAILYGFMEGPQHSRTFRAALEARDYKMVDIAEQADVIIAHSGGILFVPNLTNKQRLIVITPSYNTEHGLLRPYLTRVKFDTHYLLRYPPLVGAYCLKTLWNLYYFVTHFIHWVAMLRRFYHLDVSPLLKNPNTVVTHGDDRSWYDAPSLENVNVVFTHGEHDDCWRHPNEYLDLLEDSTR